MIHDTAVKIGKYMALVSGSDEEKEEILMRLILAVIQFPVILMTVVVFILMV